MEECPIKERCKNGRMITYTCCAKCGQDISSHHLHVVSKNYRLCEKCAFDIIDELEKIKPKKTTEKERKICMNYKECWNGKEYTMFKEKKCDLCKEACINIHFHEVDQNLRLCLDCFQKFVKKVVW